MRCFPILYSHYIQIEDFALKICSERESHMRQSENEVKAMFNIENYVESGLNPEDSIVRHYSKFLYQGKFLSFMEYANGGSLEDFFAKAQDLRTESQAVCLWDQLLRLLDGMDIIHGHCANCRVNDKSFLGG